ncbi:zinc finger protein 142 [Platysternon megacephalum]|uniref:Zinc finger protein 142 n=1 Tax=Platysternon megacephalum TaxID=55544 RepID=A0A4D9E561_9SAUR|nr:zinc finger protein 142 [Platysternon megacephalum]
MRAGEKNVGNRSICVCSVAIEMCNSTMLILTPAHIYPVTTKKEKPNIAVPYQVALWACSKSSLSGFHVELRQVVNHNIIQVLQKHSSNSSGELRITNTFSMAHLFPL